jgi:hypothetical protein
MSSYLVPGGRIIDIRLTLKRPGLLLSYVPGHPTVVVIWDDGEKEFECSIDSIGPWEPLNLKERSGTSIRRVMRVRLGLLREFLREAVSMTRTTTPSAPTDPDATAPGHLPNELPTSAALDEEAWVPGRWFPTEGEPMLPGDVDRLGDGTGDNPAGMDETDETYQGDGKGNGIPDPKDTDGDKDLAAHLRQDDDTSLGEPPQEQPEKGFYGESKRLR